MPDGVLRADVGEVLDDRVGAMTRIYDHGQLAMAPSLDFRSAFGAKRRLGRLPGSLDVD